jgi:hypothetical protein
MGVPVANIQTPAANDLANAVVQSGLNGANPAFAGTGVSSVFSAWGSFNALLWASGGPNGNWNATIQLERSFDGGTTWLVCGVGGAGQQAIYQSSGTGQDISFVVSEPESGVLYRWHCTAYSSGTINYRFSTTSPAPLAWGIAPR